MVVKFFCKESRFLNMGFDHLKRLIQEAREVKDVITLEATVVTGFEVEALEECQEKCKPLKHTRRKGRIFFNIKKENYPNVLKMRSIDNVFIVSEAFDDLEFKNDKAEDLLAIKSLVEKIDWSKTVPEWAEIVGFKGVQFPKCAERQPDDPLDENEPACQNCLKMRGDGVESLAQTEDGEGDVKVDESPTQDYESSKPNVNSVKDVFVTPSDNRSDPECEASIENIATNGDGLKTNDVQKDSAPGSKPTEHLLPPKETDTDDELAFHSAEEDLPMDDTAAAPSGKSLVGGAVGLGQPSGAANEEMNASQSIAVSEPTESDSSIQPILDQKQAKYEKQRATDSDRREARNLNYNRTEAHTSDTASKNGELGDESNIKAPRNEKRKNYWQKRKEAKAKKDAEAKMKKPPPKAYVNDGLMKFRVTCYRNGPKHSFDSNEAAGHFGGLINDKFHWTVDLTRFDINVVLVIEYELVYVTLALTNKSLHKRNILHFGPTTLRATLCYGLLRMAKPKLGDLVIDPMCGGGSIPIEGALAFNGTYYFCGDLNDKSVYLTHGNIAHNSIGSPLMVDVSRWSVRRLPLRDSCIDVFVTDLPFGLRVGRQKDNTGLYVAVLNETARVVRQAGRASLLTYDRTAMIRALQRTRDLWRELYVNMVNQGGLRCFAYMLIRRAPVASNTAAHPDKPELARKVTEPVREGPSGLTHLVDEINLQPEHAEEFPSNVQTAPQPDELPAESLISEADSDQKLPDNTKSA